MNPCPICQTPLAEEAAAGGAASLGVCNHCFNPLLVEWRGASVLAQPLPDAPDIRRIAPAGSIGAELLAQSIAGLDDLPVLPEISQRILGLLKDPEFNISQLAAIIREDPVLALAIMKQANSPAFGGLHEIRDINAACSRLGMRTIANTVQLVANRNLFITGNTLLKKSMERLWRHSAATAHCANEIARLTMVPNLESIFLAGLIHDVGKVMLLELVATPRSGVVRALQSNPQLLNEVLENLHPLLGLIICQAWNLPPSFRAAVYFHHNPAICPVKDWMQAIHITALANTLAKVEGYGMGQGKTEAFLASNPSSVALGLSDIKLATLRVDLSDTLEALFEVAG
ncbi:MAG: HDOD domain-containing protein [Candidatus Hydrogenedentes bacterium]|nr:HDOD domain-containing protein [Candidatus Hydrogenedentota bacterium]